MVSGALPGWVREMPSAEKASMRLPVSLPVNTGAVISSEATVRLSPLLVPVTFSATMESALSVSPSTSGLPTVSTAIFVSPPSASLIVTSW